jgi:hypothetical protein
VVVHRDPEMGERNTVDGWTIFCLKFLEKFCRDVVF